MLIRKEDEARINNIFNSVFKETDDCFEYLKEEIGKVGLDDAIVSAGFKFRTIPVMQIILLALNIEQTVLNS
jgi:hypothetical protein